MLVTVLVLAAHVGISGRVDHQHFDMIEVNRKHNDHGAPQFVQLIVWDWHSLDKKFHVEGWTMMRDCMDKTDEDHRKRWDEAVDRYVSMFSLARRQMIRSDLNYRGKFIGGEHQMYPRRNYKNGQWEIRYIDDDGVYRCISAPIFRETITWHDPEMEDRKEHPEGNRRGLISKQPIVVLDPVE